MHTLEYIWIDGSKPTAQLRSKTRVEDGGANPPVWNADGSSTNQAEGSDSDITLKPVLTVPDPFRERGSLVLCEVLDGQDKPHPSNTRAKLRDALREAGNSVDPWLGLEQEYTLTIPTGETEEMLGFAAQFQNPREQGPYYCGVGHQNIYGREIYEDFITACRKAKIKVTGFNWEVMPGQAEFQVSAPEALETCDHLWLARWILQRVGELHDVIISFDPKPAEGDWNGAGMHTNFSTSRMRKPGGIETIRKACEMLGQNVEAHLGVYGHDYQSRLTGEHETCSYQEFRWGVADRTASVRIPRHVESQGYGYLEDRRPNANADPYLVAERLIKTICL